MEDSFVKIMRCRMCQEHTNGIALHKRLRPIKHEVFDNQPCEKCKELLKTYAHFIGNCGHSGFIKIEALERIIPSELFADINRKRIFRMEQCFKCLNMMPKENPAEQEAT